MDIPGRHRARDERAAKASGRLPPGQHLTEGWPVLNYGARPRVELSTWRLTLAGLVDEPVSFSWPAFTALPQRIQHCDIHCVTQWSKLDNEFGGVSVTEVLEHVQLRPEATHVIVHAYGGYTTNLSIQEFAGSDCLFALSHNGEPLTAEHGGPLRLVVPALYLWKSAKWVRELEFVSQDRPGFWETYGYHMHGDPWKEERYS